MRLEFSTEETVTEKSVEDLFTLRGLETVSQWFKKAKTQGVQALRHQPQG